VIVPIYLYNFITQDRLKAILASGGADEAAKALADQRARFRAPALRNGLAVFALLAAGALAQVFSAPIDALLASAPAWLPDGPLGVAGLLVLYLALKALPLAGVVAAGILGLLTALNAVFLLAHDLSGRETVAEARRKPVANYGGESREPRAVLIAELGAYAARHPEEEAATERLLGLARSRSDCLSGSSRAGHVTGSALVASPDLDRVLLVHHAKLDAWFQPGGHIDEGETVLTAALRETLEETGVEAVPIEPGSIFDIDIHEIPARDDRKAHLHYDVRYLLLAEPGATRVSSESKAVEWVSLDEALRRNPSTSIARLIAKLRDAKLRDAKLRDAKLHDSLRGPHDHDGAGR